MERAGAAWRKGLGRRWDESGRLTGVRSGWMVKGKPKKPDPLHRLVECEVVERVLVKECWSSRRKAAPSSARWDVRQAAGLRLPKEYG